MPNNTDTRIREQYDIVRDYVREEKFKQAQQQKAAKKARQRRPQKGDNLIIKFDKWLDRWRW